MSIISSFIDSIAYSIAVLPLLSLESTFCLRTDKLSITLSLSCALMASIKLTGVAGGAGGASGAAGGAGAA